MGNKGAFITLTGKSMIPTFTTYEAVVSFFYLEKIILIWLIFAASPKRKTDGIRKFLT